MNIDFAHTKTLLYIHIFYVNRVSIYKYEYSVIHTRVEDSIKGQRPMNGYISDCELTIFEHYAVYGNPRELVGSAVIGFDLDNTIVEPLQGKFSRGVTDWKFCKGGVVSMLEIIREIRNVAAASNFNIVIFTNQGGIAVGKTSLIEIVSKLESIFNALGFSILTFIAMSDPWRKPSPLMFYQLCENYMPEIGYMCDPLKSLNPYGYFIGDAYSVDDFSDSDYRFAVNAGLGFIPIRKFITTWEHGSVISHYASKSCIEYGVLDAACLQIADIAKINLRNYLTTDICMPAINLGDNFVCVLIGPPGCGKTTYSSSLKEVYPNSIIVNRDTILGNGKSATAVQCVRRVTTLIKTQRQIVVDATHPSRRSREPYIALAKAAGIRVTDIMFCNIDIAKHLNWIRGICGGSFIPNIAYGVYAKNLSMPTREEGFDDIIFVNQIKYNGSIPEKYFDLI